MYLNVTRRLSWMLTFVLMIGLFASYPNVEVSAKDGNVLYLSLIHI